MEDKFYVSVEAARLLREKGYDKPTDYIYVIDGPFYSIWRNKDGNMESNYYPVPTKAEAIDWLESKGITIDIHWIRFNENRRWDYSIFNCSTCDTIDTKYFFPTRLEAEDAAIIRALKEITKL